MYQFLLRVEPIVLLGCLSYREENSVLIGYVTGSNNLDERGGIKTESAMHPHPGIHMLPFGAMVGMLTHDGGIGMYQHLGI